MISAVPDHIPTSLSSPPAIMQYVGNPIARDFLSYILKFKERQYIISMPDETVKLNTNNYAGFETAIYHFNNCKDDAISRYKQVYKTDHCNTEEAEHFLNAIKTIVYNSRLVPRFSFYPDGAKAIFTFRQQEITVEYDFDEPESAFVSKSINDVLHIKDTTIDNLAQVLGTFL
jgi:hypothetical protein